MAADRDDLLGQGTLLKLNLEGYTQVLRYLARHLDYIFARAVALKALHSLSIPGNSLDSATFRPFWLSIVKSSSAAGPSSKGVVVEPTHATLVELGPP